MGECRACGGLGVRYWYEYYAGVLTNKERLGCVNCDGTGLASEPSAEPDAATREDSADLDQ